MVKNEIPDLNMLSLLLSIPINSNSLFPQLQI